MKRSLRKDKIKEAATPPPESGYSFALARVAVAQICKSIGFNGAQSLALEALIDIATKYLIAIAKISAASANSNGRTQSNLSDIVFSLEDLASVQGFPGSWRVRSRSLFTSAVIKDLMNFVKYTDEISFAQPLPPRRVFNKGSLLKYRDNSEWYNGSRMKHVPRWLPVVPPVQGNEKREERETEVKWGCLLGKEERGQESREPGERKTVKRELSDDMEISEKRGKVRFKMKEELGNGKVIGKRVWRE